VDYKSRFWWTRKYVTYSGNVGTTPVQNMVHMRDKDTFVSCTAISIAKQEIKSFSKEECHFG
jgi:UDP-N-acetylmuramate dehydrogenase